MQPSISRRLTSKARTSLRLGATPTIKAKATTVIARSAPAELDAHLAVRNGDGPDLTSENGDTQVICTRIVKLRGIWHVLRPLIQSILDRDIADEAAQLKQAVESRVPVSKPARL